MFAIFASSVMAAHSAPVYPVTVFADRVVEFGGPESTAGLAQWPYGAIGDPVQVEIPLSDFAYATDADSNTSVSLPTGAFLTLGFVNPIFDGDGADIFVSEIGASGETANVFGAPGPGAPFALLGVAGAGGSTGFDLSGLGFANGVRLVKIVGLDRDGRSPGFDLAFVSALQRAAPEQPKPGQPPFAPVPAPAAVWMAAFGTVMLGAGARRRARPGDRGPRRT
jgi:hypothetical protein